MGVGVGVVGNVVVNACGFETWALLFHVNSLRPFVLLLLHRRCAFFFFFSACAVHPLAGLLPSWLAFHHPSVAALVVPLASVGLVVFFP